MQASSAEIVAGMLRVLYPDARTVLDATHGNGRFWDGAASARVTGLDLDRTREPDVVGDFRGLPFRADAFDVVIFDPPYHTDMGRGKPSAMGSRFGHVATIADLQTMLVAGCLEARRVSRLGCIVKVQDYIHAARLVRMSAWVEAALGEPFDFVHQARKHKIRDRKWSRQLSAWRNHATYWAFRWDGPVHRARAAALRGTG